MLLHTYEGDWGKAASKEGGLRGGSDHRVGGAHAWVTVAILAFAGSGASRCENITIDQSTMQLPGCKLKITCKSWLSNSYMCLMNVMHQEQVRHNKLVSWSTTFGSHTRITTSPLGGRNRRGGRASTSALRRRSRSRRYRAVASSLVSLTSAAWMKSMAIDTQSSSMSSGNTMPYRF